MLKEFAWKTFEKTGRIDVYVFYKEVSDKKLDSSERKVGKDSAAAVLL